MNYSYKLTVVTIDRISNQDDKIDVMIVEIVACNCLTVGNVIYDMTVVNSKIIKLLYAINNHFYAYIHETNKQQVQHTIEHTIPQWFIAVVLLRGG